MCGYVHIVYIYVCIYIYIYTIYIDIAMWQEEKGKPPSHPSAHGLLKWLEAIRSRCIDFSTHLQLVFHPSFSSCIRQLPPPPCHSADA